MRVRALPFTYAFRGLFNAALFNATLFNAALFNATLFNAALFDATLFNAFSCLKAALFKTASWR